MERFNKKKSNDLTVNDLQHEISIVKQDMIDLKNEFKNIKSDNHNIKQELIMLKIDKNLNKQQSDNEQNEHNLTQEFDRVEFAQIPRSQNVTADEVSKLASLEEEGISTNLEMEV